MWTMIDFLFGFLSGVVSSAFIVMAAMTMAVANSKKSLPPSRIWGFSEGPQAKYDLTGYDGKKAPVWRRLFVKPIQ